MPVLPSASAVVVAGTSKRIQCVKVPPGASGSSATMMKPFVGTGAPDHERAGDTSPPSQLYFTGIAPPAGKLVVVTVRVGRSGSIPDAVSTFAAVSAGALEGGFDLEQP